MAPNDPPISLGDALRRLRQSDPEEEQRAEEARREHENAMINASITWLQEKWEDENDAPCPYCGHDEFAVGSPMELNPFGRPNMIKAFIPVTCTNCAQTTFLDADRSTGFPIPHEMKDGEEDQAESG